MIVIKHIWNNILEIKSGRGLMFEQAATQP